VSHRPEPPILAIVRESPFRQRTAALLQSLVAQQPAGLVRVAVLRIRRDQDNISQGFGADWVEEVMAESDWPRQASRLVEESGCRWVVLPSSVDRLLPGAFETVVKSGADEDEAVVLGCRVKRAGRDYRVGPIPFRFDYFALLSGFNYIAPGATFMSARRLRADGGLTTRFPNAMTYEYLLRAGAAHGVIACDGPLVETEAHPFPGIPEEYAALYAAEAMSVAMSYNRAALPPGTTLALVGVVAQRIEAGPYTGEIDQSLARVLTGVGRPLADRYLEYLGLEEEGSTGQGADRAFLSDDAAPPYQGRWARVRAVTPQPVWNTLRRAKRAWRAFRDPL
jgi:hypothetical protein